MQISKIDLLKNSRITMGVSLFIISILCASLISKEANRTVMVWATQTDLAPGQVITENDITPVSALLPQSAVNYLSSNAQIIGGTVVTKIYKGDLIPSAAISKSVEVTDQKLVPLTVEITDIPLELSRGSVIDIYGINKRDTKSITTPVLMASNVSVSQVLERNNSGIASVLVILKNDQVLPLLEVLADSRLFIVRSY
jgi:Chaperone for flagella basal body P-ring formation